MRGNRQRAINQRRIGRKVITLARISSVMDRKLGSSQPIKKRRLPQIQFRFTKRVAFILGGAVLLAGLAMTGVVIYQKQAAAVAAKAAEVKLEAERKEKASAMACRKQKLESKRELYGKVTYDELYDGNSCDNLPQ